MTREEVIELLEKEKVYMIGHGGNMQAKALDIAIKAVNEEPFKNACIKQASKERDSVLDKIKAEIKEWYWQADKQALAKDPCVVDAMVDLFIRTIDKYKAGNEV